jgi:hypothetical protein
MVRAGATIGRLAISQTLAAAGRAIVENAHALPRLHPAFST